MNQIIAIKYALISARYFLVVFFSAIVFFGVFQFGLRWEATVPSSQYIILVKGVAEPIYGTLTNNWVGDLVATSNHGERTVFSHQSLVNIHSLVINEQGYAWRLMLSVLIGIILSFVTAVSVMQLTNDFDRFWKPKQKAKPAPRPVTKNA